MQATTTSNYNLFTNLRSLQFTVACDVSSQFIFTCHLIKTYNNVASESIGFSSRWQQPHNFSWLQLLIIDCLLAVCGHHWLVRTEDCLQTRSEAEAYCRQSVGTVIPGIEPPLGPMVIDWFSVKTFAFFLCCSSL
jgi:hypothetical protein